MTDNRKRLSPWLFVLPSLVIIILVTIFPTIYSIGMSFFKYEPTLKATPFIGLGNYAELFRSDRFMHAVAVTALLVSAGVFAELIFGFWFAHFVHGSARGRRIVVTLMLLPVMVMPVVVGYTWKLLWDAQFGPINQVIGWIIGRPFIFTWLGQPSTALFAMIVTEVWQWTPFMFLVFYAGMAGLDAEIYEASELDGASGWQQFWRLTVPLMRPIIVVAVLIRSLDAIKAFDIVFTLTGGAPGTSTETVSYFIYKAGYQFFRLSFGAAAAIVLLIALSVILTILLRVLRRSMV